MSRNYLIFHIKSFREGSVQHFSKINNIFESENKQRKNTVVLTCEFKKKKNTGPSLRGTHFTTLCILRVISLTLREVNKLSFLLKFERFLSKNGKQILVEELSFKSIVASTIGDSYQ